MTYFALKKWLVCCLLNINEINNGINIWQRDFLLRMKAVLGKQVFSV